LIVIKYVNNLLNVLCFFLFINSVDQNFGKSLL